ncbi:MAG: hypothetical protein MUF49_27855 [Oculatellaceae cyanobacterium Prado106]|jgi:hypothetical protein|nr:hypothetical protein [Oculatellaceae cyanobacterium Prado106]
MSRAIAHQPLPSEVVRQFLEYVTDYVKQALSEKAVEMDCSMEAVVEMAIASFVAPEAFSFEDCLLAKRLGH